jgi:hypothetical protein
MTLGRQVDTAAGIWLDGLRRHLADLRNDRYEGATGQARETHYRAAFNLLTPVATSVLSEMNAALLRETGDVSVRQPASDGQGGLIGSWMLSWPALRETSSRFTGARLLPVTISAVFPQGFVHPHLVAGGPVGPSSASLIAWPMQVKTAEDAAEHRPVLWAIATAEIHDRIFQSSWRIVSGD